MSKRKALGDTDVKGVAVASAKRRAVTFHPTTKPGRDGGDDDNKTRPSSLAARVTPLVQRALHAVPVLINDGTALCMSSHIHLIRFVRTGEADADTDTVPADATLATRLAAAGTQYRITARLQAKIHSVPGLVDCAIAKHGATLNKSQIAVGAVLLREYLARHLFFVQNYGIANSDTCAALMHSVQPYELKAMLWALAITFTNASARDMNRDVSLDPESTACAHIEEQIAVAAKHYLAKHWFTLLGCKEPAARRALAAATAAAAVDGSMPPPPAPAPTLAIGIRNLISTNVRIRLLSAMGQTAQTVLMCADAKGATLQTIKDAQLSLATCLHHAISYGWSCASFDP